MHDGSPEVLAGFPYSDGQQGVVTGREASTDNRYILSGLSGNHAPREPRNDSGSAARFFYSAKADAGDRLGSKHPTVKPVDLMRWLVRLVTPPGGHVLDPFAGSGTTAMACLAEGFHATLIEREAEYVADIRRRLAHVSGADTPLFAAGDGP
jgi:DNA modification methylase